MKGGEEMSKFEATWNKILQEIVTQLKRIADALEAAAKPTTYIQPGPYGTDDGYKERMKHPNT